MGRRASRHVPARGPRTPRILLGPKRLERYEGLVVKADTGLHDQVAAELHEALPPPARVLDLGAGQGALSARLRDLGYDVTAVDVEEDEFAAPRVSFVVVDFNDAAAVAAFADSHRETFDAVVGVEVIEHVEDQWAYVRLLASLVRPGGVVVVTTPNVTSWLGRLTFLRSGRFHQFADSDLSYGHIAPVTPWELRLILERTGLDVVRLVAAGTLPPLCLTDRVTAFASMAALPLRPFQRGLLDGWCVLAVARVSDGQSQEIEVLGRD